MATIDLGKIAITPEGKWSAGKYYEKLSLVIFNGQSYLSLRDTTGDNPETSRSDWMQITSRGESLYQMMVREGKFVGTEEEFLQQYLDSLKACADASEEVRAALSDILNEMDRVRAEISEVMVEEDIRIKNEAKREAAEINRKNAEITRGVEERNRQEAEQRREQSMQQIQNDAEIALAMAAEAQQKAEEAILNEEERISAENQRKIDEATRIQHEEQRVNDEAMRRSREADRLESENIRQKNEGDRILAEREREEIMRNLVEELKGLAANKFKIVDVLPEVGEFAVIYLVPSTMPSDNDVYDEWAYVSEKWERIGSTRFKIDNYFTKEEVERLLVTKQDTLTPGNGISIEGNKIGVTAITESESQPHTSLWVNPSEDEETDVTYNRSQIDAMVGAKQDALTAGNGISIEGNVISSSVAEVVDNIVNAGYVFAGVATPATDPSTSNAKVFYIANGKGTYTNFGGIEVTEDEVVVLKYDTAWHKVATGIASQEKLSELESKIGDFNSQTYLESTTPEDFFTSLITYYSPIPVTISGNSFSTNNTSGANKTVQVKFAQNNLVIGKEYKMYFKSTGYAINGLYVGSTLIANAVKEGDYYTFIWTHRSGTLIFSVTHPYNVTSASVSDIVINDSDFVLQTFIVPSKLHNIGEEQLSDDLKANLPNESYPTDYSKGDIGIFTKCLCVGDSLTAGVFNRVGGYATIQKYSYPSKLKSISGIETTNLGNGGMSSAQWYDAHINDDLSGHDFAIIQLGVNDALQNGGWTNESKVAFTNIINKIKAQNNNIKIFVATIIPATSYSGSAYDSVSEGIRNLVTELADTNVICLDMAIYGHTKASSAYNCGHLSAYGYWRLAKDYYNYISWYIANHQSEFREVQFIGTDYTYE